MAIAVASQETTGCKYLEGDLKGKRESKSVRQDASPGRSGFANYGPCAMQPWRGGGHPSEESTLGLSANYGGGRLCPTYPLFVRHRGCHARRLVRSSHTRVRGLADNKPTQVASRSESNAPWAPEANEFERKSFRPQTALGLELKKKKKKQRGTYT